jgi:hypothetical protein
MSPGSSRKVTLADVWLDLTPASAASLEPRLASRDDLIAALVGAPRTRRWATAEELAAVRAWLESAALDLNDRAIVQSLNAETHELTAEWVWPDKPLVHLYLDSEPVAFVDYLPASASAHWFLRWAGEDVHRARGAADLPIITLAGHVPEEAEREESMLATALDEALSATAAELTGRVVRIETSDA